MSWWFRDGDADLILVSLDGQFELFEIALSEWMSTRPIVGGVDTGPSTYYLDFAEKALREAIARGQRGTVLSAGQFTDVWLDGDVVRVAIDGEDRVESMPAAHVLSLIADWRSEVVNRNAGDVGNSAAAP